MNPRKTQSAWTWRPPRVRFEPPTTEEAIAAAQGMTDDYDQQIEIAAGLMGIPVEELKPHHPAAPKDARTIRLAAPASGTARTVIVERKSRRTARPLPRT